jgi:hypothetical protein
MSVLIEVEKTQSEDVKSEFFRTPRNATRALIAAKILPLDVPWLEPCAGDGAIIRAVPEVREWWAMELRQKERQSLLDAVGPTGCQIPREYQEALESHVFCPVSVFSDAAQAYVSMIEAGVVITNPPNSLAWDIAMLLRQWCPDAYLAILQPVTFGCTMKRLPAILRDPPDCYRLAERPDFIGSGGLQEYAWWVWSPGIGGQATFKVLPPEGWYEARQGVLL